MKFELDDIQLVCGWMSGIFSGVNIFDLQSSSATKIKSKVVGVSFGVHCIEVLTHDLTGIK